MKKLILLTFISLIISIKSYSATMYGGIGYTYGILSAESEFWNGGDGSTAHFTLGSQFDRLALELSFRSLTLENTHTTSSGTYNIEIKDLMFNLGIRYDLNPFSHVNVGLVSHSVTTDYTTTGTSRLNSNPILGSSLSAYLGGGLHGVIFTPNLRWSIDFNYFHRSTTFGIFSIETGIFYSFYTF